MARTLFLALVALLPVHTVFFRVEVAWKPWLLLLVAVALTDLWRERRYPWEILTTIGLAVFLITMLVSWPDGGPSVSFWRLWLGLAAGGLLMLVTGRHPTSTDAVLRTVFWSGLVLAGTAFVFGLVTSGVFGEGLVGVINDLPFVDRINKPAYLASGFVAVTNWHQDPGYAALWTNLWLGLSAIAWARGSISAPRWLGPLVVGGLGAATILTYSRTGWAGLVVASLAAIFASWRDPVADLGRAVRVLALGALVGLALIAVHVAVDPPGVGGDVVKSLEFRIEHLWVLGAIDLGEEGVIDPTLVVGDNRIEVWKEYLSRFADHPVRGIGLATGWAEPGLQEPHNLLLQLFAETGVIGFLGFLTLLFSLGRGTPVAGAALVIVGTASLAQTVLFEPVLWFGLGLWLAGTGQHTEASERAGHISWQAPPDPSIGR